jgi:hypothetical protein
MAKKLERGQWDVTPKDGRYLFRAHRDNGERVRMTVATRGEGDRLAAQLFPSLAAARAAPAPAAAEVKVPADTDDWGLPRVSPQAARAVNEAVGAAPAPPPPPDAQAVAAQKAAAEQEAQKVEIQKRRRRYASTLCEMVGYGYAMGVGMVSANVRDPAEFDVVKPSPKHIGDLGECSKEALESTFGDKEIGPWTMTFLLSIGIPLSVFLQSRRKKKPDARVDLKSVP